MPYLVKRITYIGWKGAGFKPNPLVGLVVLRAQYSFLKSDWRILTSFQIKTLGTRNPGHFKPGNFSDKNKGASKLRNRGYPHLKINVSSAPLSLYLPACLPTDRPTYVHSYYYPATKLSYRDPPTD